MKKATALSLVLLFSITVIHAQRKIKGNGNVVTIERTTGDYDALRVGGFYEVELVEGNEGNIVIKGEENLLEYIETEVKGGVLTIKSRDKMNMSPSRGEDVYITIPVEKIDAVRLSGAGQLNSTKTLEANNFKVQTSGSRKAELNLNAKSITVITSGSSDVKLSGSAEHIDVTSSGSSNVNAFDLNVDKVEVRSSGSSDVNVSPKETLTTRVSGSGDVRYRGNPNKINNKISGSGEVSKD
ncbi:head GIN domain-containing protein [Maribacter halichondriae]|uniref:head GIN domain-containing protein n=1 Tax=Maribacter halichondriae TaxID=2980554 RepID=UPI00235A3E06|nr:head GIN domain-containing protein [Maribacter sp. Hal144]